MGEARATANSGTIVLPIDDLGPEVLSPVPRLQLPTTHLAQGRRIGSGSA